MIVHRSCVYCIHRSTLTGVTQYTQKTSIRTGAAHPLLSLSSRWQQRRCYHGHFWHGASIHRSGRPNKIEDDDDKPRNLKRRRTFYLYLFPPFRFPLLAYFLIWFDLSHRAGPVPDPRPADVHSRPRRLPEGPVVHETLQRLPRALQTALGRLPR